MFGKHSARHPESEDISTSVEVLTPQSKSKAQQHPKEDVDGWQTVRSRYRRGSTHSLNMSTRYHKPSTAISLPALCIDSSAEKNKKNCLTPDGNPRQKRRSVGGKLGKNMNNEAEKVKRDIEVEKTKYCDSKMMNGDMQVQGKDVSIEIIYYLL